MIGFTHADPAEAAEVGDGILHTLYDETVAGVELLAVFVHLVAEDAGVDGDRDLGGAGRFRTVTDDAR